jgi:hypothetical protein
MHKRDKIRLDSLLHISTKKSEIYTHDGVFRVIGVEVNTANEHGCIGRWSGDNDFLGTTLQVSRSSENSIISKTRDSLFGGSEDTLVSQYRLRIGCR